MTYTEIKQDVKDFFEAYKREHDPLPYGFNVLNTQTAPFWEAMLCFAEGDVKISPATLENFFAVKPEYLSNLALAARISKGQVKSVQVTWGNTEYLNTRKRLAFWHRWVDLCHLDHDSQRVFSKFLLAQALHRQAKVQSETLGKRPERRQKVLEKRFKGLARDILFMDAKIFLKGFDVTYDILLEHQNRG